MVICKPRPIANCDVWDPSPSGWILEQPEALYPRKSGQWYLRGTHHRHHRLEVEDEKIPSRLELYLHTKVAQPLARRSIQLLGIVPNTANDCSLKISEHRMKVIDGIETLCCQRKFMGLWTFFMDIFFISFDQIFPPRKG